MKNETQSVIKTNNQKAKKSDNKKMKTYKIFCNNYKKSEDLADNLRELLNQTGKFIEAENAEFVIAIGGDGCLLNSVKEYKILPDTKFVGINTGTLGFLQEIKSDEIQSFVSDLVNENYKIQKLSFLECTVVFDGGECINGKAGAVCGENKRCGDICFADKISKQNCTKIINCLNEIVVRDEDLRIVNLKISVDGEALETFAGDGVLVATSTGSTAYNLSLGGSIVHEQFHTLQLTPIAPLTTIAHSLTNSLIMPETSHLEIVPAAKTKNLILCADGINTIFKDVKSIKVETAKKRIQKITMGDHTFWQKINEKILRRGQRQG